LALYTVVYTLLTFFKVAIDAEFFARDNECSF